MIMNGECVRDPNEVEAGVNRLTVAITYVNEMNTFYYVLGWLQFGFLLIVVGKGLYNLWDKQ